MKRLIAILFAATLMASAKGAELTWLTDAAKAQAQAREEKKLVLLDFTGSDWCIWCQKLSKEVFATDEFAAYAKTNLVLVEVDFPRKKTLSDTQKAANEALAKKYGVRGFPTLVLLDSDGRLLGQLSYIDGVEDKEATDRSKIVAKPAAFIAAIEKKRRQR